MPFQLMAKHGSNWNLLPRVRLRVKEQLYISPVSMKDSKKKGGERSLHRHHRGTSFKQNLYMLRAAQLNCYRGGPHMRSLISIDFPAPEMEPESAHVVSAVSVPLLQCGDCNAAPPRQHSPIRRYSAYSATPWYVLIQLPNVIDTISKRWRSKRAFNTSPSHIFP